MRTPVEEAAAVYEREDCPRTFREDLEAHLLGGYVWCSPTSFGMARPVCRSGEKSRIVDPYEEFQVEDCDAWLLYLAAGDLRELVGHLPYELEWIGWERENVLRWYPLAKVLRRLEGKGGEENSLKGAHF